MPRGPRYHRTAGRVVALLLAVAPAGAGGCAALTNPVADGIPVRNLPREYLGESRANLNAVPLGLLRQPPPDAYRLAPGDVLGVVVEGVLGGTGDRREATPVRLGDLATSATPAQGFPVPVREDGTVALPQVAPINLDGLTLAEATAEVRKAFSSGPQPVFQPGRERVTVDLLQPRQYSVLVVREDGGTANNQTATSLIAQLNQVSVVTGSDRRGTGTPLRLPAYENDVLNALTRTGGLPGLDSKNHVVVHRAGRRPGAAPGVTTPPRPEMVRVPVRMPPGPPPTVRLDDIVLGDGDIVYVEARGSEVFYTGGLLGATQVPLPKDYDLDVIQAIAIVRGPIINGGFTQNAFVANAVNPGLGNPNPTLITVIRPLPDGKEVRIRIDMARALRDPQERVRVLPNDLIILQETPEQAITRYFSGAIQFNLFATLFQNTRTTSLATGTFP